MRAHDEHATRVFRKAPLGDAAHRLPIAPARSTDADTNRPMCGARPARRVRARELVDGDRLAFGGTVGRAATSWFAQFTAGRRHQSIFRLVTGPASFDPVPDG